MKNIFFRGKFRGKYEKIILIDNNDQECVLLINGKSVTCSFEEIEDLQYRVGMSRVWIPCR